MSEPYVFISYKSEDVAFARELVQELDAIGLGSWAAYKSVRLSHAAEIPPAIRNARAVVILMSSRAYASDEVLDEVYLARDLKLLRLPILLPGETDPVEVEGLSDELKDNWRLERARRQFHPWRSAASVAAWIAEATAGGASTPATTTPTAVESTPALPSPPATTESAHEPLALVSSLGQTYQLDAIHGLGEHLLDERDPIEAGDLGHVALSPDGLVIATLGPRREVAIWTLGSATSLPGPALDDVLPPGAGTARLLGIDRPIGQAIRITAARGGTAYSLIERRDGSWGVLEISAGSDDVVAGASVADDVLLVRSGGDTVWAGDQAKRPFGLRTVRGVDAAVGPDGRQYLAGWGLGRDGSPEVEAVVETGGGWERVHRGPGERAGILRVLHDVARQRLDPTPVTVAVASTSHGVQLVPVGGGAPTPQ